MTDDYSPADALASVQAQRDRLAEQAASPPGYHIVYGLIFGVLIAAPFFQNLWILAAVFVAWGLGVSGLIRYYTRAKGMWINGHTPRPARKYAVGAGAVFGVGYLGSFVAAFVVDAPVLCLVLTVVAVPALTWLGYRWDAAYARDLRAAA